MTREEHPSTARSLRDWLHLLGTEIVDLAARAIVAAFDPGARTQRPTPICPDCAARARAAGHTVVPAQNGPTQWTPTIVAANAVPPPPVLPAKTGPRAGTVAASCPICGPVTIADSRTITGVFYQDQPNLNWYGFTCPTCRQRINKHAGDAVTAELRKVHTGIRIDTIPTEALEPHPTGVLTRDDVLDAILELDTHDNLAALAADAHQPKQQPREIDLRDGDR